MKTQISFTLTFCTATCVAVLSGIQNAAAQQADDLRPATSANTPATASDGPQNAAGGVIVNPYATRNAAGIPQYQYPAQPGASAPFPVQHQSVFELDMSVQEDAAPRVRLGQELGRLMTILSDSQDEEERGKATEAAEKTIAEYFDLDLQSRRQELDRVMQRAADMEETLTKREAAKEELVDLQMKSLELDANGLGLVPTVRSVSEAASTQLQGMNVVLNMAGGFAPQEDPRSTAREALQTAYHNYRQAMATEGGAAATATLREALSDFFDADMEVRRAELAEIRAGLEKLQQAIEKRAEARDEIIQVELQLILNQANGLGFFGDAHGNAGQIRWQPMPQISTRRTSP